MTEIALTDLMDHILIGDALKKDRAGLLDRIKTLYNCRDADVHAFECDAPFVYISIADPQKSQLLDADGIARVARMLREGKV